MVGRAGEGSTRSEKVREGGMWIKRVFGREEGREFGGSRGA